MTRLPESGRQRPAQRRAPVLLALVLAGGVCWSGVNLDAQTQGTFGPSTLEEKELEVKSEFSRIVIRRRGNLRSLFFVREGGMEALESKLDLGRPHRLLLPYTQYMFASYLVRPQPERVLIVGLGGGAMVHFLKHHDPDLGIDVVEIDPVVVKIAAKYFAVTSEGKVKIILQDAARYLTTTQERYDVIYMDAFLKPSAETDDTGVPLRLTTIEFFKSMQKRLKPGGAVVFNLHLHGGTEDSLADVRSAFPQVYVFEVSHRLSLAVVGSLAKEREELSALRLRAKQLDGRFRTNFSFEKLVKDLSP